MPSPADLPASPPVTGTDAAHTANALLADALEQLHSRLRELPLPLDVPDAAVARGDRRAALDQLDDYLLPRLRATGAPLLVVVGGSTGAGKSTLVNSLLGARVTEPGVLRPTTRSPVLVHHPLDGAWFASDRVLPGMARLTGPARTSSEPGAAAPGTTPSTVSGRAGGVPTAADEHGRDVASRSAAGTGARAAALRLVASEALPRGLALLDAPDVDSVEVANRDLAAQLLAAADLWVFVTTAARYADAVPWDLLHDAARRHAQVALVVDRVDPGAEAAVTDLRRLMDAAGLDGAPLFAVEEGLDADGLLPERAVGALAAWLSDLGDDDARETVALRTRDGAVDDLGRRALGLAAAADAQVVAEARLRDVVARAYAEAGQQVTAATSDGAMLRGEVLARWQELVGTGELLRSVEQRVGRLRDVVVGFLRGRPAATPPVEHAIAQGLASVVLDAADGAAERTHGAWRGDPAGAALLPDLDLSRSSASLRAVVEQEVRDWQSDVLDLVREQGAQRRGTARALSFGVNALGVALMVLAFASTGGLTGVEVGIAGGTAVVAQKLLEAVFGDDAVRRLTTTARERLAVRVQRVLADEAARYSTQLDALGVRGGDGLRAAALAVGRAASAERAGRARTGAAGTSSAPGATETPGGAGALGAPGGSRASGAPGAPGALGPPGASGASAASGPGRATPTAAAAGVPARPTTRLRGADHRPTGALDGPAPGAPGTPDAAVPGRPARGGFWRRLLGRDDAG